MKNTMQLPAALVALAGLVAPPAGAAKVAVLAWREGSTNDSALANDVRASMPALRSGDVVLDADTLRRALRGPVQQPVNLVAIKTTLAAAEEAFAAVEHERAVSLIESAISDLEHDADFSVEKHEILQAAHLRCARLLLGLAGPKETGRAETPQGVKARGHLEAALRTDPTLALDPTSTPPKLRSLLGLAAAEVKKHGYGAIAVTSSPSGATVFADGRALGLTPLTTADTLARGPYRIWVSVPQAEYRSFARVVQVGDAPAELAIDLGVEGAAWPEGPGLSMPVMPLHPPDVRALATLVGADEVVVTGTHAEQRFVAVFTADGALRRSGQLAPTATGQQVATFVVNGSAAEVTSAPLFAEFYSPVALTTADEVADSGPWLGVGLGVGAAVVAAGAVGAVLYFTRTQVGTFDLTLKETP